MRRSSGGTSTSPSTWSRSCRSCTSGTTGSSGRCERARSDHGRHLASLADQPERHRLPRRLAALEVRQPPRVGRSTVDRQEHISGREAGTRGRAPVADPNDRQADAGLQGQGGSVLLVQVRGAEAEEDVPDLRLGPVEGVLILLSGLAAAPQERDRGGPVVLKQALGRGEEGGLAGALAQPAPVHGAGRIQEILLGPLPQEEAREFREPGVAASRLGPSEVRAELLGRALAVTEPPARRPEEKAGAVAIRAGAEGM